MENFIGGGEEKPVDIHELFAHYNSLYFDNKLEACFVSWTQTTSSISNCNIYHEGCCEISLSEPILKSLPTPELKNTLLHEMIHAFLWLKDKNKDHCDHGSSFQAVVDSIITNTMIDHQTPDGGYNLVLCCKRKKRKHCGDYVKVTRRRSSENDSVMNVVLDDDSSLSDWNRNIKRCSASSKAAEHMEKDEMLVLKDDVELCDTTAKVPTPAGLEKAEETKESDAKKSNAITRFYKRSRAIKMESHKSPEHRVRLYELPNKEKLKACEAQDHGLEKFLEASSKLCTRKRSRPMRISLRKRKFGKRKPECTVMSAWMGMYIDEEDDEDVEPLVLTTERQKRHKLLLEERGDAREDKGAPSDHLPDEKLNNIDTQATNGASQAINSETYQVKEEPDATSLDGQHVSETVEQHHKPDATTSTDAELVYKIAEQQDNLVKVHSTMESPERDEIVDISD